MGIVAQVLRSKKSFSLFRVRVLLAALQMLGFKTVESTNGAHPKMCPTVLATQTHFLSSHFQKLFFYLSTTSVCHKNDIGVQILTWRRHMLQSVCVAKETAMKTTLMLQNMKYRMMSKSCNIFLCAICGHKDKEGEGVTNKIFAFALLLYHSRNGSTYKKQYMYYHVAPQGSLRGLGF